MNRNNLADLPVIIRYDSRFLSKESAQWIAGVLSANGIKVLFLNRSAPTPLIGVERVLKIIISTLLKGI